MTANDPGPDAQRPQPGGDAESAFGPDAEPTYVPEQPSPHSAQQAGWPAGPAPAGYPGPQPWFGGPDRPSAHSGYAGQYGHQFDPYYGHRPYGGAQPYGGYGDQYGYGGTSYYGGGPDYGGRGYGGGPGYYGTQPIPHLPPGSQPGHGPSAGRRALIALGALVVAAGLVLSGVAIAQSQHSNDSATGSLLPGTGSGGTGSGSGGGTDPGTTGPGGNTGVLPGGLGPSTGQGSGGSGTSTNASVATKAQQAGVVTIVSVLGYQQAESAGTGMIVSSDGEVLTNNHVIDGATSITVTVASTDKTYRAQVVGTVPTQDVAVLKLRDASGLTTAKLGDQQDVADLQVGDAVTGVGNAGGTGTLRAASGKVTALDQSITASDESGGDSEKLSGLIEIDAGVISGDSGGPLYDSHGEIVGMDTAASTGQAQTSAYAIPIDHALSAADKIESGTATATVHIGLPAFIGVTVAPNTTTGGGAGGGATIYQVIAGGPAAKAGLTAGSTITKVGDTTISDADALKAALSKYRPGDKVRLSWTDVGGSTHTATVTTIAGPAD